MYIYISNTNNSEADRYYITNPQSQTLDMESFIFCLYMYVFPYLVFSLFGTRQSKERDMFCFLEFSFGNKRCSISLLQSRRLFKNDMIGSWLRGGGKA